VFELGTGPERKRPFARYSPLGSRSPDAALAELTEQQLLHLFRQSQPAWTSPESAYGALYLAPAHAFSNRWRGPGDRMCRASATSDADVFRWMNAALNELGVLRIRCR